MYTEKRPCRETGHYLCSPNLTDRGDWSKDNILLKQMHRRKSNLVSHYGNPIYMRVKDRK